MRSIGNIPFAPPFQLAGHQLAQVLCQVHFSPVLRIREDDAIIPFQEAVRTFYPRYARQQGMNVLITPGGVQQQSVAVSQHFFEDSTGTFSAVLSSEFVALQTSLYVDIDDFIQRITTLAEKVNEFYEPAEVTRIGLRFINELRLTNPDPKEEMREAIAPVLLGALSSPELAPAVVSAQQSLELSDERIRVLVNHGFHPLGGTTVSPTNAAGQPRKELAQPFYLLDIDAYVEEALSYSVDGVETLLREFNDQIRSFFAWSVNERYRVDKLGQSPK